MSTRWLDTADVVWLDTVDCVWLDIELLVASLEQENFDELFFDTVAAVTPADVVVNAGYIFVGTTGAVKVRLAGNKMDIVFNVLTAGSWIKLRVDKIYSENTSATDIVLAN